MTQAASHGGTASHGGRHRVVSEFVESSRHTPRYAGSQPALPLQVGAEVSESEGQEPPCQVQPGHLPFPWQDHQLGSTGDTKIKPSLRAESRSRKEIQTSTGTGTNAVMRARSVNPGTGDPKATGNGVRDKSRSWAKPWDKHSGERLVSTRP